MSHLARLITKLHWPGPLLFSAFYLRPRRPPIIVLSSFRRVIREAIIIKIDLSTALLKHVDDSIEGAETVCILRAAGI